jgi:lysophospholipase L1-like esterase
MAAQARSDGARFLLVGNEADLRQLDIASIQHEGAEVARADDVLGADQRAVRFPNDGHLTPDGHRRIADLLTPRIAALLP